MTRCSFVAMILVPGGGLLLPTVIIKILRGPGPGRGHTALQLAASPITKLARVNGWMIRISSDVLMSIQ